MPIVPVIGPTIDSPQYSLYARISCEYWGNLAESSATPLRKKGGLYLCCKIPFIREIDFGKELIYFLGIVKKTGDTDYADSNPARPHQNQIWSIEFYLCSLNGILTGIQRMDFCWNCWLYIKVRGGAKARSRRNLLNPGLHLVPASTYGRSLLSGPMGCKASFLLWRSLAESHNWLRKYVLRLLSTRVTTSMWSKFPPEPCQMKRKSPGWRGKSCQFVFVKGAGKFNV